MSKIDTLIQELQQKKKKLDYLDYIKDLLAGDQKCVDFVEVQDEVLGKLLPLIDKVASEIEESVASESKPSSTPELTVDDVMILKRTIQSMKEKAAKAQDAPKPPAENPQYAAEPTPPPKTPGRKEQLPSQDKMSFAMDNRHMANKKVRVLDKNSNDVITTGTVVGLDAPNVIVKTIEGPTIEVPLNKVLLGETA